MLFKKIIKPEFFGLNISDYTETENHFQDSLKVECKNKRLLHMTIAFLKIFSIEKRLYSPKVLRFIFKSKSEGHGSR